MKPRLLYASFRFGQTTLLLAVLIFASSVMAQCPGPIEPEDRLRRAASVTVTGAGIITAWGIAHWDYFSTRPSASSEGWFGQDSPEGGADKLGHLFTTYATAQGISSLFEHWCFTPEDAARYGALSSFAILGYMELGDAFSDFGFSYEDLIANAAGALAGYYRYRYPSLARKVDLRWEVGVKPNQIDLTTDYDNSKYLVALKLNGFDTFSQGFLRHVELHAGYYTRGYSAPDEPDERTLYVGIGLNLTDLFRRNGYSKTATFLNYYQPPGTYLAAEETLGD
ncbi:DUF2279 domain-containing protein [Marinobacter sp. F4206]|uniref:DUF2279 domain-containing protein n=1 Tax=Marinobacter sp. F4206 TaxID=2861777 RepID=UPI001C5DA05D|nr:DUF2279 domain-containing protein [Marinobacter sp. F4206]MBW4934917.1 YfiM family protein [Marinobacter sp. F4206]